MVMEDEEGAQRCVRKLNQDDVSGGGMGLGISFIDRLSLKALIATGTCTCSSFSCCVSAVEWAPAAGRDCEAPAVTAFSACRLEQRLQCGAKLNDDVGPAVPCI